MHYDDWETCLRCRVRRSPSRLRSVGELHRVCIDEVDCIGWARLVLLERPADAPFNTGVGRPTNLSGDEPCPLAGDHPTQLPTDEPLIPGGE